MAEKAEKCIKKRTVAKNHCALSTSIWQSLITTTTIIIIIIGIRHAGVIIIKPQNTYCGVPVTSFHSSAGIQFYRTLNGTYYKKWRG